MKKLLNYLLGYVIISIKGEGVERFLNIALQRGMNLWDIKRKKDGTVQAQVHLSAIKPLRHVARKSRCSFRIVGRAGLPFQLKSVKKRKSMVVGGILFLAGLYVLSSFVFFIDVTSQEPIKNVSSETVKRLAREKGVVVGRPKWLMDFTDTEKYLMNQMPQLSWVNVSAQGTKVEIEIVEKVLPEPGEKDKTPGNVVAFKDGVVTEILVMRGQARVASGDTVSKGEVLISGLILPLAGEAAPPSSSPSPDTEPELVRADGIVRAKVWYRGYGECPIVEKEEKLTGKSTRSVTLKWGDRQFGLWGDKESPYPLGTEKITSKKINWPGAKGSPLEIIITTYGEGKITEKNWGAEGAKSQAVQKALLTIQQRIPPQAQIVNQEVKPLDEGGDGVKRVFVVIETEEEIGKFLAIE
ncbi:sporulation protein YqfD [Dehalobacterium formicoaceticum]|uniref:Sporulation protein YqfD n=1 Tax=Dehalobacterium formicoaceticum TaxID=51515 RepID=A0ABT1XZJ2_9FIRM|nr:sporulation protein YqfD [Dehalobacterium formicoaceticum]